VAKEKFDKNKLCRWQIIVFFTKNCKNSKNSETTSTKSPINQPANRLLFLETQRLVFFLLKYLILCMLYCLYRLWCFDFEWLIAFDKFFSIKSRMEACPRLDMFPQPSFVCAQESSSLGLAVKKLIRVRNCSEDVF
jgi:hypothetical protein